MSEDRSLTDFAGDTDTNETEATADTSVDYDTEPANVTYRWQPNGATCADCGTTTERGWRDDGAFVCPDCKSW